MRKQIIIAALLAAIATTPAMAQDRGGEGRGERGGGNRGAGHQQAAPAQQPQQQAAPQAQPQAQPQRPQGGQQYQRSQGRAQYQRPQNGEQYQRAQGVQGRQFQGQAQTPGQPQSERFQGRATQWNGQRRDARPDQAQQQQQQQSPRVEGTRNWQGNRNGTSDPRFQNRDRNENGVRDGRWNGNDRNGNRDSRYGNNGRDGNRDWRGNNGGRGQSWNRDWRRDQRYNWQSYRSSNRNFYRLPRYESPYGYGYGYRRFGIGAYLDSVLFSQDYWIDNPYEYRLPEAYPPYHWVRYFNDALLVDDETGYVVDTIYDFFIQ
ncbi:hypothetical protein BH09PSE3_BH09PSE3_02770 [soil metagenome]